MSGPQHDFFPGKREATRVPWEFDRPGGLPAHQAGHLVCDSVAGVSAHLNAESLRSMMSSPCSHTDEVSPQLATNIMTGDEKDFGRSLWRVSK